MPLPEPIKRKQLHIRTIEMNGYSREDGLFDIDGRLTDIKTEEFVTESSRVVPAGEPLHDMRIRLVFDKDLHVHDVVAVTDASPHPVCREATLFLERLKGLRMSGGWRAAIGERLAGEEGCAHLKELLNVMASAAYQSLTTMRKNNPMPAGVGNERPKKLDSCLAYSSRGPLVMKKWPQFFTGGSR
jgi:hypothetical protein